MDLIPAFGGTLQTVLAFVVAISIIVAIHEYGHYIVGRWSGIKADVFSIGFGKIIWSRVDRHGTRWQVAALPLGGYVKFRGDSDAASGKDASAMDALTPEDRRATMHGAPLWARTATVAAGPVFNFILSILLFAVLIAIRGVATDPLTVDEVYPTQVESGLLPGDEVLSVAGVAMPPLAEFQDFVTDLPAEPVLDYTVLRDGEETVVTGPYPMPPRVSSVTPRSAADRAGLRENDVITAIDGTPIVTFEQLRDAVGGSDGRELALTIWRDGEAVETRLTPKRQDTPAADGGFETRWLLGVSAGMAFSPAAATPGPLEALGAGVDRTVGVITTSVSGLWAMITGDISTRNINGPLMIAVNSGDVAERGVMDFVAWIAVLSTAVGFLNLFPIPVLDGGHLVFFAWEAITGHPPGDRALNAMMTVGLALLGTLMVFALSNDVRALFFS